MSFSRRFKSAVPVAAAVGSRAREPASNLTSVPAKRHRRRPVFVSLSSVTPPPLPPPTAVTTTTATTNRVRACVFACARVYTLASRVRPCQSVVRARACTFTLATTIILFTTTIYNNHHRYNNISIYIYEIVLQNEPLSTSHVIFVPTVNFKFSDKFVLSPVLTTQPRSSHRPILGNYFGLYVFYIGTYNTAVCLFRLKTFYLGNLVLLIALEINYYYITIKKHVV